MTRERRLHDASGKVWSTRCEGCTVTVVAGAPGKEKTTAKEHKDAEAALSWARKEEWARLKKGHVLANPEAAASEPRLHVYLGGGYTGGLFVAALGRHLVLHRQQAGAPRGVAGPDELVVLAPDGALVQRVAGPPKRLFWSAVHLPAIDRVVLRADHEMLAWKPGSDAFDASMPLGASSTRYLAAGGTCAAWYAEPAIVVRDLARDAEVLRYAPELASGVGPREIVGALSADASLLAVGLREGEVELIEVATGQRRSTWSSGFNEIAELSFSADGRWLVARGTAGHWTLRCLDLTTGASRPDWPAVSAPWKDERACDAFALEPGGGRMAMAKGERVDVVDLATMKRELRFAADHVVRRAALGWVGDDALAVRTDYGCASIYALGRAEGASPVVL